MKTMDFSRTWPSMIAALIALVLLISFYQVVRQAVHQGELLRTATATHSEAVRRCSSLRGLRIRESCLTQMNSAPDDESSQQVQVQGASTVSTVEPHRR